MGRSHMKGAASFHLIHYNQVGKVVSFVCVCLCQLTTLSAVVSRQAVGPHGRISTDLRCWCGYIMITSWVGRRRGFCWVGINSQQRVPPPQHILKLQRKTQIQSSNWETHLYCRCQQQSFVLGSGLCNRTKYLAVKYFILAAEAKEKNAMFFFLISRMCKHFT